MYSLMVRLLRNVFFSVRQQSVTSTQGMANRKIIHLAAFIVGVCGELCRVGGYIWAVGVLNRDPSDTVSAKGAKSRPCGVAPALVRAQ